jgi:hypothetical protein
LPYLDLLSQFSDRNVGLRLNHSKHVNLDRFAQAASNAIARLGAAHRAAIFSSLPAQLAHILPTHTKAIGKNTA